MAAVLPGGHIHPKSKGEITNVHLSAVSFLHSLSAHCGPRAGTIVQTYTTPQYRSVRENLGLIPGDQS